MTSETRRIVISKEDAVFRLDREGHWQNDTGRFQHKKIIDHFHKSIRKDEGGFHLYQRHGDVEEKVYFPFEDTALFVFDAALGDPVELVLNTGRRLVLDPAALFVKNEALYVTIDGDPARFTDRVLMQLAGRLEETDAGYVYVDGERRIAIPTQ